MTKGSPEPPQSDPPEPRFVQAPPNLMGTQLLDFIVEQRQLVRKTLAKPGDEPGNPIIGISRDQARTIDTAGQVYTQGGPNQDWCDGLLLGCWVTTASRKQAVKDAELRAWDQEPINRAFRQLAQNAAEKVDLLARDALSQAEQGTARQATPGRINYSMVLPPGMVGDLMGINIYESKRLPENWPQEARVRPALWTNPVESYIKEGGSRPMTTERQVPPPLNLNPRRAPIDWDEDAA